MSEELINDQDDWRKARTALIQQRVNLAKSHAKYFYSDDFSKFDELSSKELYDIIHSALSTNNISEAWQAIIRIIEKDVQ